MSKAKKTKKAKKYSAIHLYRHITEVLNHSDKEAGKKHNKTNTYMEGNETPKGDK